MTELTKEFKELRDRIYKTKTKRIVSDYGVKDIYKYYKGVTNKEDRLPYSIASKILKDANKAIADAVMMGNEIELGDSTGRLLIKKRKINFSSSNRLKVDWGRTKKTGIKVYHLNEHRNGYNYRWFWKKTKIKNSTLYSFIACRRNKRTLSHILKNIKEVDYTE